MKKTFDELIKNLKDEEIIPFYENKMENIEKEEFEEIEFEVIEIDEDEEEIKIIYDEEVENEKSN